MSGPLRHEAARLPDDPAYWESLAARIEAGAASRLDAPVWWARPRLSPALAAAAIVAVAGAWLWLPATGRAAEGPAAAVDRALRPADPLAERLLEAGTPPGVDLLLGARAFPEDPETEAP